MNDYGSFEVYFPKLLLKTSEQEFSFCRVEGKEVSRHPGGDLS